jgi:hypothetical protein
MIMSRPIKHIALGASAAMIGFGLWAQIAQTPQAAAIAYAGQLADRVDVIEAIARHNLAPKIDLAQLDALWRLQRLQPPHGSLVQKTMSAPLSKKLATLRLASAGQIMQVMVMDKRGALVAADHITHDYDQSDEPKWQLTVGQAAKAAVFEWQQRQKAADLYQISKTVADANGEIVGAVTLVWCSNPGQCSPIG